MKVLVAGSRSINNSAIVAQCILASGFRITELICGMASGVDLSACGWARQHGIPVDEHPANWKQMGMKAGMIRNGEMVALAEAAIIIWDGISKGTKNTINRCRKADIPYRVWDRNGVTLEWAAGKGIKPFSSRGVNQ